MGKKIKRENKNKKTEGRGEVGGEENQFGKRRDMGNVKRK